MSTLQPAMDSAEAVAPREGRWLSIVGIGEDGVAGLSPAAAHTIATAPVVIGGRRHLALAASLITGEAIPWASPLEATFPVLLARRGQPTCVLATGDPFHYGIGNTLAKLVPAREIACLPQPSAFSLVASRLGWALQECHCLSLHGRVLETIEPWLCSRSRVLVLSWDRTTPPKLADLLIRHGFGSSSITVCEALGGPRERVRTARAEGFSLEDVADLNTIALDLGDAVGSAKGRVSLVPGRADALFEHDGQITKAAIRAVTLAALAPVGDECLWDVGGGSGSISIEWLLAHPGNRAIAVEARSDRAARLRRNATHWGVSPRLTIVEARAPACLTGLPSPHAIFIGGGLTALGLVEACRVAVLPGGRLVANAVTLESQALLGNLIGTLGGGLTVLSVATAEPVGVFHGLRPAMPVMQWRWERSS